ncbi:MAG: RecX family transcriptional regulator, partial [Candidatus Marinimicrobia bacterium]|nr:RecX family transcriptional regulator [Candidatus Neomarinimicrobiota bacterium]
MHGITVGQDISIDLLSKIKADELFHSIRSKALNFLSYRDRSTKELERSLLQKGYHYDQIKIILDELTLKGYLNDKKFTRVYANHLIKTKLLGKIAVINRFMKHNIPQEVLNPIM